MSSYLTAVNMYSRGCRLWGQRWVIGVSPLAGYPATKCWIRPWTRMPASAKKNLLQLDFLVLEDRRYSRVHLLVQPLLLSSQVLRNTGVLRQPRLPLRNDHIGCGRQVEGRGVCVCVKPHRWLENSMLDVRRYWRPLRFVPGSYIFRILPDLHHCYHPSLLRL